MTRFVALLAAAGTLSISPCSAAAQTVHADAIEVRLFLQHAGTFSAPLTESSELWNIVIGATDGEETTAPKPDVLRHGLRQTAVMSVALEGCSVVRVPRLAFG